MNSTSINFNPDSIYFSMKMLFVGGILVVLKQHCHEARQVGSGFLDGVMRRKRSRDTEPTEGNP